MIRPKAGTAAVALIVVTLFASEVLARVRCFSPEHGQFTQRDPAGYVDGMNLYEYERSNPVMGRDAHGLRLCVARTDRRAAWLETLVTMLAPSAVIQRNGLVVITGRPGTVPAQLVWEIATDQKHTVTVRSGATSEFLHGGGGPPTIRMSDATNQYEAYFTREWNQQYPLVEKRRYPENDREKAVVFGHELIHAYYRLIKPNRHGTPIPNQHVFGELDPNTGQRRRVLYVFGHAPTRREEFFDVGCSYVKIINPATSRRPSVVVIGDPTARYTENGIRQALGHDWKRVSYVGWDPTSRTDITDDTKAQIRRVPEDRGE